MVPDRIEALCNQKSVRAIYMNPTLHNPTSIIYSENRKREIASLAKKYDFLILEDDILVTDTGHQVIGQPIPKSVSDVEKIASK
jgi:DNA-binding transcriptional MocR family regulator